MWGYLVSTVIWKLVEAVTAFLYLALYADAVMGLKQKVVV